MRNGIPNLGALQAFEATARLGSFSRAAEELSLTHSAVYRQVTGLEDRLGVQLFTRVRRRVALTDAGSDGQALNEHLLRPIASRHAASTHARQAGWSLRRVETWSGPCAPRY